MNILIPMAGRGKRFVDAGFKVPKPLIDILGKPMIKRAVESMPPGKVIFVTRDNIAEIHSFGKVIKIDHVTEGAACTCLIAESDIDNDEELLIADSDAFYNSSVYWFLDNYIRADARIDACGICFRADTDRNSYVRVDENGWAIETAEKKVISNLSFTGMHWFRRGKDFVAAAKQMIDQNDRTNNEFYVSPVYNYLIRKGLKMKPLLIPNDWVEQVGVPEDLYKYLNKHATIQAK